MSEHTPIPWGYVPGAPGYQAIVCAPPIEMDPTGIRIAGVGFGKDTTPEQCNANAEFIVRAVNSYDDMLAALTACRDWLCNENGCDCVQPAWEGVHDPSCPIPDALLAIAKATQP